MIIYVAEKIVRMKINLQDVIFFYFFYLFKIFSIGF